MATKREGPLGLFKQYGIAPWIGAQEAAGSAVDEGQHIPAPPAGDPTDAQRRIDAQGAEMTDQLGHDMRLELEGIDAELVELASEMRALEEEAKQSRKLAERAGTRYDDAEARADAVRIAAGEPHLASRRVPTWLYVLLLAVFGAFDIVVNSLAFMILGESRVLALVGAVSIAVVLLFLCHGVGNELGLLHENPERSRRRRLIGAGIMALTILVGVVAIGLMRSDYLTATGQSGRFWTLVVLQIMVAVAAMTASYFHTSSWADDLGRHRRDRERADDRADDDRDEHLAIEGAIASLDSEKLDMVIRYLQVVIAVLDYTDELKAVHAQAFRLASKTEKKASALVVAPTFAPGWALEAATWVAANVGDDRPNIVFDWESRALPVAPGPEAGEAA